MIKSLIEIDAVTIVFISLVTALEIFRTSSFA